MRCQACDRTAVYLCPSGGAWGARDVYWCEAHVDRSGQHPVCPYCAKPITRIARGGLAGRPAIWAAERGSWC